MATILTILAALPLLHWLARVGEAWRARSSPFRVRGGQYPPAAGPTVSVLNPARDEEANIERCMRPVQAQDPPPLEVLVLDDRSTDRTGAIVDGIVAEDERVRRIEGTPLPEGWKGKCHALQQAAEAARGEWLLMVDADVELAPAALSTAMGAVAEHRADMVSWFATLRTVTLWERILQPFILDFILTHSDPRRVNDLARPDAIANGQFLAVRAAVYRTLGGHAPVKDSIVEDMAYARLVKGRGYRYRLLDGVGVMTTRMYTGWAEIREGWTKNFFAGLHGRRGVVAASVVYLALTGVLPHLVLGAAVTLVGLGQVAPWALAAPCAAVGLQVLYRLAVIRRTTPLSILSLLLHPVGAIVLAGIILDSARRAATGTPVTWKGREYDAGGGSAEMP